MNNDGVVDVLTTGANGSFMFFGKPAELFLRLAEPPRSGVGTLQGCFRRTLWFTGRPVASPSARPRR